MNAPFEALIKNATKAPSAHNTQPWKFRAAENRITIYPDYDRSLQVVDPDNHALFISLGCALENLLIAAQHFGFSTSIEINTEQEKKESISVRLNSSEIKTNDFLYNFIDVRQATRNRYNGNPIPAYDLEQLKAASRQEEVQTIFLTNEKDTKAIIDLIREGNRLQFNNPSFIRELIQWIRFNKKIAIKTGDGLYSSVTGNPSVPTWFGRLFMKLSLNPKKEDSKLVKLLHRSPVLAIFIAETNDKKAWLNVGRSFQRTMLMAASLSIHHAHANMACEEVETRKKLKRQLHLSKEQEPLLLVRLGYSEKMPYSFRRPIEDVLLGS